MQQWSDALIDPSGNVVDGATVTVRLSSTAAIAAIYSDNGVTSKANPFVTGTDTNYGFYAANGTYTVTIAKSGYTPVTHEGVVLFDQADDTLETASSIVYSDTETYPDGTIGDALASLFALANAVAGTANQITITDDGAGTLTWSLPLTIVAPGSLAVTGKLSGNGTATNDNASAGQIGEVVESIIDVASAVSLTTGTTANVTSISLTAGDWEIVGHVALSGTATNTTYSAAAIGVTSATLPADEYTGIWLGRGAALNPSAGLYPSVIPPQRRSSQSGTQTLYLLSRAGFSGGTATAFGFIRARRVR